MEARCNRAAAELESGDLSGSAVTFYAEIAQKSPREGLMELRVILALQRAIVGYVNVYLTRTGWVRV